MAGVVRIHNARGVADLRARDTEDLGNDEPDPGPHADAVVPQLRLSEPREEPLALHGQAHGAELGLG
eukprot:5750421-Heterocapsa_arctica.AAC.1